MMKRLALAGFVLALASSPVGAADDAGAAPCSKLAWNLDHERALMTGKVLPTLGGGATLVKAPGVEAFTLALSPTTDTGLPYPPGRTADPGKFEGFVYVMIPAAGDYLVSLSSEGWIDLIQGGAAIVSTAHTGDGNCPGLRKSVRFTLGKSPAVLQISSAPADHIVVAITKAP